MWIEVTKLMFDMSAETYVEDGIVPVNFDHVSHVHRIDPTSLINASDERHTVIVFSHGGDIRCTDTVEEIRAVIKGAHSLMGDGVIDR